MSVRSGGRSSGTVSKEDMTVSTRCQKPRRMKPDRKSSSPPMSQARASLPPHQQRDGPSLRYREGIKSFSRIHNSVLLPSLASVLLSSLAQIARDTSQTHFPV